jgi:predicted secreted Zn-dependent protease
MLKKLIHAFAFIVPLITIAQDNEFIEWSATKRLTWNDYLASPSTSDDIAAITSTALGMEYHVRNNSISYKISCHFSKTKSWGRYKTDYILQHEQGHFDITEIFARKLVKAVKEYKFDSKKYQDDLGKIYKKIMEEKEEFQGKYDDETDFSRNKTKQAEWLKKIAKELEDLEEFADYS